MQLINRAIFFMLLTLFSAQSFARDLTNIEMETLGKSINLVSDIFNIPRPAMYALYLQERGWPGAYIDVGSSADMGVFQINNHSDNWLPILESELGLDAEAIQWSIVGNAMAAGYILSVEYDRTDSWVEALGNYHRHKRDSARERYVNSITSHLFNLKKAKDELAAFRGILYAQEKGQSLSRRTAGVNFE